MLRTFPPNIEREMSLFVALGKVVSAYRAVSDRRRQYVAALERGFAYGGLVDDDGLVDCSIPSIASCRPGVASALVSFLVAQARASR